MLISKNLSLFEGDGIQCYSAKGSEGTPGTCLEAGATEWEPEAISRSFKNPPTRSNKRSSRSISLQNIPDNVFEEGETNELLGLYQTVLRSGSVSDALSLLRKFSQHERSDVLKRVMHKEFMKAASKQRMVKLAIEFVELLPTEYIDRRTYNMLARACVRDNDLDGALLAAQLMQKRGFNLDLPMYTNLILAHGMRGDVHEAFQVYAELKAGGWIPDCTVAGALANVCSSKMKSSNWNDRRGNLVLLERASGLLRDLNEFKVNPDTALWNVMVTCAGRAGQVHRAFNILQEMQERHCRADSVTYSSLIDACVKGGRRDLAMDVYGLAIKELKRPSTTLYTVALEGCMCGSDPVDSEKAFEIYREAQRSGQPLDVHFFSTMIRVAGKAGMPQLALSIETDMRVQGIDQSTVTCSALISAALASHDLALASKIYTGMVSKGIYPNLYQFTNLMQAFARAQRYGDIVRLVQDMFISGRQPDDVLADILLSLFKDPRSADLGFAVFTLLRGKKVRLTERVCFSMLDICHMQIKTLRGVTWHRSEYKPLTSTEGTALLKAFSNGGSIPDIQPASVNVWVDRSISIYKSALSGGVLPNRKLLSKVLSCLRLPHSKEKISEGKHHLDPFAYPEHRSREIASKIPVSEQCFDKRVLQLVKEAIQTELIPPFFVDRRKEIDLRDFPPTIAEAYVFTILETLKFRHQKRATFRNNLVFKVPPFDPRKVLVPSVILNAKENGFEETMVDNDIEKHGEVTALAAVSVFRRLRLWHHIDSSQGVITLSAREIAHWLQSERIEHSKYDDTVKYMSPFSAKLAIQQSNIRIMNEQNLPES